jgi:hypothetical protein
MKSIIRQVMPDGKSHSKWGVHRDMAIIIYEAFCDINRRYAPRWAVQFIIEHQSIKTGDFLNQENTMV